MIVVDTSALMAIILDEPEAAQCAAVLEDEAEPMISAATLAEALIVAGRRGVDAQMDEMVREMGAQIIDLTAASAHRAADAYRRWGKGVHPAGLNFADCFAYALAEEQGCPLLYVGGDFARTDIRSAI